jgi:hypothetical protein
MNQKAISLDNSWHKAKGSEITRRFPALLKVVTIMECTEDPDGNKW